MAEAEEPALGVVGLPFAVVLEEAVAGVEGRPSVAEEPPAGVEAVDFPLSFS